MPLVLLEKECEPKCRSRKHAQQIISFIAQANLREFQAYSRLCHNWAKHADIFGRTALHVAASYGKTEILEWLLEETSVDASVRDSESGYTALHRAVLYGQLACAHTLIQHGADLQVRDAEGLNPLDIAMMDRPPAITYSAQEPNEVYTWGENNNSTLGHPSPHKRISPEAVDLFKKMNLSIKQVVLCKYHSVFLTQSGQVYTCGHGPGGRLGHDDQHTILVPRLLESVKGFTCLEVAAATDHTVLRMEGGVIFSFGLNVYHQLGQTPMVDSSPLPRQMNLKALKGTSVHGVCVGRFHTVVWTADRVYTVGLNAGQLGHQKGEKYLSQLHQVSCLRHTELGIARVACSDAAIVCLTTKGDVFLIHEYQCRKISFNYYLDREKYKIDKVLVTGGHLNPSAGLNMLTEKGGQELVVMMRNELGQLFTWRGIDQNVRKCHFVLKRQLAIADFAMASSCLVFATKNGEAFMGYFSNRKSAVTKETENKSIKESVKEYGDGFGPTRIQDLIVKEMIEEIQVRRLPVVHRAVMVAVDRKGRNFAVFQALPNSCMSEFPSVTSSEMTSNFGRLLQEAHCEDNIQDVVIQVENRSWPAHRYILAMRSDFFRNLLAGSNERVLKLNNVGPDLMEQLLQFIYTDTCDYLQPGFRIPHSQFPEKENLKEQNSPVKLEPVEPYVDEMGDPGSTQGLSAYQAHLLDQKMTPSKRKEAAQPASQIKNSHQHSKNPVKLLQDAARNLGVKGLSKRLDAVASKGGVIVSQGKTLTKPKLKFDRAKLPELYDVKIRTQDGQEVPCHKCVLVSRLEYFHSMLATGWIETSTTTLTLPTSREVLEILLDFLYTDEAAELRDCSNEELLCNMLVVADQLLAWRLKEMCEVDLANNISFKNVSELLEFARVYNASQLKVSCQQFIAINMSAVLEGRYLDVLSQETLDELIAYYKSSIPSMAYRFLTPVTNGPSQSYIDDLVAEYDKTGQDNIIQHASEHASSNSSKQPRKRTKSRKMSGGDTGEVGSKGSEVAVHKSENISLVRSDQFLAEVEELNRQAEDEAKKMTAATEKAKQLKQRLFATPGHVTPAGVPTLPEDIPTWNSSLQTLAWSDSSSQKAEAVKNTDPVSPVSTSSPTPPSNFREILHQQSESAEKKKSAFSSRISWKDIKKQQSKDQKDKQQKLSTPELANRAVLSSPALPAKAAWSQIKSTVQSFRDLMVQEKQEVLPTSSAPATVPVPRSKTTPTSTATPSKATATNASTPTKTTATNAATPSKTTATNAATPSKTTATDAATPSKTTPTSSATLGKSPSAGLASWGLSLPVGGHTPVSQPEVAKLAQAANHIGPEDENPWQRRATLASSPPQQAPLAAPDFSAILKDEKEKSESLVRTSQKPLALIQLEEKAMLELFSHYSKGKESEYYITVERVSKQVAAPLWHRDQKSAATSHF